MDLGPALAFSMVTRVPPYAGIVRIRFKGSRRIPAPLSHHGSPAAQILGATLQFAKG